eukprot:1157126-Pelagomonas_calceolata.AAC.7
MITAVWAPSSLTHRDLGTSKNLMWNNTETLTSPLKVLTRAEACACPDFKRVHNRARKEKSKYKQRKGRATTSTARAEQPQAHAHVRPPARSLKS